LRKFIDLHLVPGDTDLSESMLNEATRLGFTCIGLTQDTRDRDSHDKNPREDSLDITRRIDLRPRNPNELTSSLRRIRRRFEIVAVECRSKPVARQAARDHRVDILNFPTHIQSRRRVRFDRQEASLASGTNCAYEINLSDLLNKGVHVASRLLSMMTVEVENARRYDVPVVVSSGADEPLLMRGPRELAASMQLLGIREEESLDMVSDVPWRMVERNRSKLEPGYVSPGVRRV
jgi:ribonuclease P/MRP protein subunit RPP1